MKLMIVVVALALYGCGGSAFSAAESDGGLGAGSVDTGVQADAAPMADGSIADSVVVDSGSGDAVTVDTGMVTDSAMVDVFSEVDGANDIDANSCTPSASSPAVCTGGQLGYVKPSYYFVSGETCDGQGNYFCEPVATPLICQCAETYNCACIFPSGGGCAADSGVTCLCNDSTGTVVITCS